MLWHNYYYFTDINYYVALCANSTSESRKQNTEKGKRMTAARQTKQPPRTRGFLLDLLVPWLTAALHTHSVTVAVISRLQQSLLEQNFWGTVGRNQKVQGGSRLVSLRDILPNKTTLRNFKNVFLYSGQSTRCWFENFTDTLFYYC